MIITGKKGDTQVYQDIATVSTNEAGNTVYTYENGIHNNDGTWSIEGYAAIEYRKEGDNQVLASVTTRAKGDGVNTDTVETKITYGADGKTITEMIVTGKKGDVEVYTDVAKVSKNSKGNTVYTYENGIHNNDGTWSVEGYAAIEYRPDQTLASVTTKKTTKQNDVETTIVNYDSSGKTVVSVNTTTVLSEKTARDSGLLADDETYDSSKFTYTSSAQVYNRNGDEIYIYSEDSKVVRLTETEENEVVTVTAAVQDLSDTVVIRYTDGTVSQAKLWKNAGENGDQIAFVEKKEGEDAKLYIVNGRSIQRFTGDEYTLDSNYTLLDAEGSLEIKFVNGALTAEGEIKKNCTYMGEDYTAVIGFDEETGKLTLVGIEKDGKAVDLGKQDIIMANDLYWSQVDSNHLTRKLSEFDTYEEYLAMTGIGHYDEKTDKYICTEQDIKDYIEEGKSGKSSSYYENMTMDSLLEEHGLFTREEFEKAKERGDVYAIEIPEEDRIVDTRDIELSDLTFEGLFGNSDGDPVLMEYTIKDASLTSFGFQITANSTLTEMNKPITMAYMEGGGGEGGSTDPIDAVLYQVGASIDGGNITLTKVNGGDATFEIIFNAQSDSGVFDATFSQFLAGTQIHLVNSNFGSSGEGEIDGNIDKQYRDITYADTVKIEGEISIFCGNDTQVSGLSTLLLSCVENKTGISGDGKVTINRSITDYAGSVINATAQYNGETGVNSININSYVPAAGVTNNAFAGGEFKNNVVDYGGFLGWNGKIKLTETISTLTVEKNWFVRGVEVVTGVALSVVGLIYQASGLSTLVNSAIAIANGDMQGLLNAGDIGNNQVLKASAALIQNKQYSEVTRGETISAAWAGVAAIAAIAVTIATAGTGTAAFLVAVAATVSAVSAGQSAFKASESFQRWAESGFKDTSYLLDGIMNTIFCATAIFGGGKFLNGLEAAGITSLQTLGQVGKQLFTSTEFWKTVAIRAGVGAVVGGSAGLTVQLIANNGDFSKVNWWGVAAFAGIGALTGAATTNIGNVMASAGNIGNVGSMIRAVDNGIIGADKMLNAFKFTNTIFNLGKNTIVANSIVKPLLELTVNNLTNMRDSDKTNTITLFNSAVDVFMFMSAVGLNTGKALDKNFAKEVLGLTDDVAEHAKNFGLIGNITHYGFGNALKILGNSISGTIGGIKGAFKNAWPTIKNVASHPFASIKNGATDAWNYMRNTTLTNRGIAGGLIGGGIGGVAGGFIGGAVDGDENTWWSWQGAGIGAGIGTIVGGGLGNLSANGGTTAVNSNGVWANLKTAYSGTLGTLANKLSPTNLFTDNVEMISRIISFRLTTTGLGALADVLTDGKSTELLKGSLLGKLDSWMSDQGVGLGLMKSIDDLASGLKDSDKTLESLATFSAETNATISSPEMWMFGLATGLAQPLLGPILVNSPILGTIMQPITRAGAVFENNETLSMMYEEGFQEGVSGLFGKLLFGDSAAGEIFQELFDQTPNFNANELLASANINKNTVTTNSNSVNSARTQLSDTLRDASSTGGIPQATFDAFNTSLRNGNLGTAIDTLLNDATIPQATRDSIKTSYDNYVSTIQSGLSDLGVSVGNIEAIMSDLSTQMYTNGNDVSKAMIIQAVIARAEASGVQINNDVRTDITEKLSKVDISGMNINQVINSFYASVVTGTYDGSSFDVSKVSDMMKTTSGISALASYINSISAKGNNAELGKILNAINETLRSGDYNDNVTKTNELLLQTQMLLSYVSSYDVVKNIPEITEIKDTTVNFDRMININNTTIVSELAASMTNITNQAAQSYVNGLKDTVADKLKDSSISTAERAYYTKLNDVLNNTSLTPIQIRQILNTNNAQLFAQTTLSERSEISGIRNELRELANNVLQEKLQMESVIVNDNGISNAERYELQVQTMGLNDINLKQFSVSDIMNLSDSYTTSIVSKMFTGNNIVENMRSVYSLEGNTVQSRLARQQLGEYLLAYANTVASMEADNIDLESIKSLAKTLMNGDKLSEAQVSTLNNFNEQVSKASTKESSNVSAQVALYQYIINSVVNQGEFNQKKLNGLIQKVFEARQQIQKDKLEQLKAEHKDDVDDIVRNRIDSLLEDITEGKALERFNELTITNKINNLISYSGAQGVDKAVELLSKMREGSTPQLTTLLEALQDKDKAYVKTTDRTGCIAETVVFVDSIRDTYWSKLTTDKVNDLFNQLVRNDISTVESQQLRDQISQDVFGKSESELTFVEKLALDLRISAQVLKNSNAIKSVNAEHYFGTETSRGRVYNQVEMLMNNLLGRVSALETAGGKSFVFIWTSSIYAHLTGTPVITEFLAAKATDAAQMVQHKNNTPLTKALGLEVVSGEEAYSSQRYDDLISYYDSSTLSDGSKGRIISYSLGTRGFVELTARMSNDMLDNALSKATLRVADEADVAALSRTAFIQGSGNTYASTALVNHVENIMNRMKLDEISFKEITEDGIIDFEQSDELAYTFIGDKLYVTKGLRTLRDTIAADIAKSEKFSVKREKFTSEQEIKARFDNILRGKYAREIAAEKIVYTQGGVGTVEGGTLGTNTTDQSAAYNIALILMELADIEAGKAENTAELDRTKIKLSESVGESTISQIFSRGQGVTLNCGGSATLDVAREIAHTIFGGEAVSIQSSTIEGTAKKLGKNFEILGVQGETYTRDRIINENAVNAAEFLRLRATYSANYEQYIEYIKTNATSMYEIYQLQQKIKELQKDSDGNNEEIDKIKETISSIRKSAQHSKDIEAVKDWWSNYSIKVNNEGDMVGLLIGGKDMSYVRDTMIETMRQLLSSEEQQRFFEKYGGIKDGKFVNVKNNKQFNDLMEEIFNEFSSLQPYRKFVQGVDAVMAENDAQTIADQAGKIGQLTFSNESSLRGVDYQSIDVTLLDGHNFSESDMLQALGRAGRDPNRYGDPIKKVYVSQADLAANLAKAENIDQWFSSNGRARLFGNDTRLTQNFDTYNSADSSSLEPWEIIELSTRFQSLQAKSESVLFKANNEAMYILVKEPIAELARKARISGSQDADFLQEMFVKVITHAESELLSAIQSADNELSTPEELIKRTFDQAIQQATKYLNETLDGLTDENLKKEIEWRLLDLATVDYDSLQRELTADPGKFDNATFARASRDAYGLTTSPATDVAKVLARLSAQVLPGTSMDATSTPVSLKTVVEQSGLTGHEASEFEQKLRDNGFVTTRTDGSEVVSAKGQLYSKIYNGDDDWVRFFEWLFGALGIDLDGKATGKGTGTTSSFGDKTSKDVALSITNIMYAQGYNNLDTFTFLQSMYKDGKIAGVSVSKEQLQYILNPGSNPTGMEQFSATMGSVLPSRSRIAVAKLLSDDSEYYKNISDQYNKLVNKYNEISRSENARESKKLEKEYKDLLKDFEKLINPALSEIAQGTDADLKVQMAITGIPVTANTDIAISNMFAYLKGLSDKEAKAVREELKLRDINGFANMPSVINRLAQKGLISLTDKERYVLEGIKGKGNNVRIGDIRNLMEQTRGTEERPIDLTLPTDEEILEIAARMTYPTQEPKVFADRYNFVMDNVELDVIDAMSLSVIADGDNFVTGKDDKVVSTWKGFEEEYERLLKATTIGEIVDTENEAIKYRRAADIMDTYGEAKYKKLVSAYRQFERTVGRDRVLDIMKSPYSEKVSEAEAEAYDLYLKKIMDQGVEDYQNIAQRLAYNKVTGNNEIANDIEGRGIKYNRAKENYNKLVEFFKGKDIPEEEAKKLAGAFTLEEMASETFTGELEALIDSGLITVDKDSTRDGIYGKIKGLTPSQIRDEKLEKQLEEKKLTTIETVLEATGLDMENVRENNEKVFNWLSESELLEELDGVIKFDTELTLGQLSDGKKVREMMKVTADEYVRDTYMGKSYAAVVEEIGERNLDKFVSVMGAGGLEKNKETIEQSVGEALAGRDISIKEHNEIVARVLGAISIEDLSNADYIVGVEKLISSGVITAEDIMSGKAIGTIIKGKKEGEVRSKVGEEYSSVIAAVGLGVVLENKNKLEEKYSKEVERAVISEMNISELADTAKVESLISDEKAMEARVMKFGNTLTMNKAKEISTREGISLAGIINGATDYLGNALYDKRAEELRKYIDVDNLPIRAIIDNENVVEEVKGLNALEVGQTEIEAIVKEAGKNKKSAVKTIKGRSVGKIDRLMSGMSEEQKDRLYKYLGINKKTLDKKIKELKAKLGVPEGLAMESVSVEDVYGNKDTKSLARRVDSKVKKDNYSDVTVDAYLGLSEEERARYGADQVKIDARVRELVSGEDAILKGYIVGDMSVRDILGEGVAEGKIKGLLDKGSGKEGLKRYYNKTRKYYEKMSGEDFMKATEEISGVKVNKTDARKAILEDKYTTFRDNYYGLSRATRFGEVVKKVSVEVLSSDKAKKSIEAVVGDGKLTEEQVTQIVLVIEESKEEDSRDREVLGEKIKPVLEESQVVRKTDTEDCVDVAVETMGKIIPLRALTQAALRATPYVQDKLKAAGVGDTLEGTELGELRQRTGLSYATMKERDIDLTKIKSKDVSEEKPLVLYMKDTGHAIVVTEISDGLVAYKRVDSKGKETEEIKSIKEFKQEEGSQGIVLSGLKTPFVAYMEKEGSDIGHVVTVTEISDGYVTYTGTDAQGRKIEEMTTVESFFKEEGFSGLMLTAKGEKEVTYVDSGVKEVVGEMFKRAKSNKYGDGKEMLEKIIDGVTAPGELNKALKYVLSIWNKDATAMLEYIGLKEKDLGDKEAIIQNATRKITEAISLGKEGKLSEAEVKVEIELVTTLRDLLITAGTDKEWLSNAGEEEIMARLIVSKAVNQNVIVGMFDKALDPSVSGAVKDDFVIDVKKLQFTIVDKNLKFAKDAKIEDVMELLAGADKKYKTPMMNFSLRNIHAVAAAA